MSDIGSSLNSAGAPLGIRDMVLPMGEKRLLGGPALAQTGPDGLWVESDDLGPFFNTGCIAADRKKPVIAPISILHDGRFPSAISGLVMPIVVNAAQTCPDGPFAHVGDEVIENQPAFTNSDSTAPISMEVAGIGVEAARL